MHKSVYTVIFIFGNMCFDEALFKDTFAKYKKNETSHFGSSHFGSSLT